MSKIEVIGAGFGRTGTMSLYHALNELGFKSYHMREAMTNNHLPLWCDIADGTASYDSVLGKYTATTDFPACTHYKALLALNPTAKVIMTVREADSWYESARQTIFAAHHHDNEVYLYVLGLIPQIGSINTHIQKAILGPVFKGVDPLNDREGAIRIYNEHIEDVRRSVPEGQLLMFSVRDGWEPLCAFLGVPVPKTPFPKGNDVDDFKARIRNMIIVDRVIAISLVAAASWAAWKVISAFL